MKQRHLQGLSERYYRASGALRESRSCHARPSVSPCTRISGQLGSEENLLGDDNDWQALKGAGERMAGKEVEAAEAAVLNARQEAFENGCDIAPA